MADRQEIRKEGGRDKGLGRKHQGLSPVRSNFNGSTLTSEGGGKQAGSLCSRAQKGRSVGDEMGRTEGTAQSTARHAPLTDADFLRCSVFWNGPGSLSDRRTPRSTFVSSDADTQAVRGNGSGSARDRERKQQTFHS